MKPSTKVILTMSLVSTFSLSLGGLAAQASIASQNSLSIAIAHRANDNDGEIDDAVKAQLEDFAKFLLVTGCEI